MTSVVGLPGWSGHGFWISTVPSGMSYFWFSGLLACVVHTDFSRIGDCLCLSLACFGFLPILRFDLFRQFVHLLLLLDLFSVCNFVIVYYGSANTSLSVMERVLGCRLSMQFCSWSLNSPSAYLGVVHLSFGLRGRRMLLQCSSWSLPASSSSLLFVLRTVSPSDILFCRR